MMFEDVTRMIEVTAKQQLPVSNSMQVWLQYCRDSAPDLQSTWDEISRLDFDADFRYLTRWVTDLIRTEPLPPEVNGLWFGMFNPILDDGRPTCQVYLAGSTRFDKSEPYSDWQCGPEYWPNGRYANSEILTAIYRMFESIEDEVNYLGEGCLCQGYFACVIANWCGSPLADSLMGADRQRAITMGFDSGDMHFIHLPQ